MRNILFTLLSLVATVALSEKIDEKVRDMGVC
jgi:hypothetical protein